MSKSTDQSLTAEKKWRPHVGPQTEAFRYFFVDEILYGGAKGGGKTDWLLFDFIDPALIQKPHYRGIIFRRTFPRLREVVDRSQQWFTRLENPPEYGKNDRCWTFPTGAKLFFAHCQYEESKYDYQGHEYHYMGFDQVEEFTESQVEFLKVQCRTTDPEMHIRIRATANPGNVGHLWVKRRWIDDKMPMQVYKDQLGLTSMYIPAKVYDNPAIMDNDPMYVKRLEALPEQDRKALLEGDWNIFAGQYFKEWRPAVHVIEPFHVPTHWKRFISLDYGSKKPASVGWWAIPPEGGMIRYKEIYQEGNYYDKLAKEICEVSGQDSIEYLVADPAIFGDKQHHQEAREGLPGSDIMQRTINKWYEDKGRPNSRFTVVRGDNRRIEGWRNVKQMLKIYEDSMGQETADLRVFSTCTSFTTVFPANVHDKHKPEDVNTDGEDHNADECRYAVMSRPPGTDLTIAPVSNPLSAWGKVNEIKKRAKRRR